MKLTVIIWENCALIEEAYESSVAELRARHDTCNSEVVQARQFCAIGVHGDRGHCLIESGRLHALNILPAFQVLLKVFMQSDDVPELREMMEGLCLAHNSD